MPWHSCNITLTNQCKYPWWPHQMDTLSALLAICAGNSPVTDEFPAKRSEMWSFDIFFDLRPKNGWVNNREAGDLRCHLAQYDIIVMSTCGQYNHLTHLPRNKMAATLADDTFKCLFLNENIWISFKILLKFAPKGPINNIPALVKIMAWHWLGNKPLSEPMVVSLQTHMCHSATMS